MSDLLKRLEALSPEKRELVLQKLKKQQQSPQNNGRQIPPLTPVSRKQPLPLSFAQARLWFLDQLEGENCVYNVPFFWQISGFLNITALKQAITAIVQRHEVLRTTFSFVDESPIQVIHATPKLTMQVLDWQQLTEEDQLKKAQQLAAEELQQPFDLSNPPLLRVKLLQLSNQSHLLLLVIHHIACDGWSMQIFRRELFTLYTAFCAGEPCPLPELSLQYADFAHWQRQWLQGEVLQTQLNYWHKQLAEVPPLLELPTDRPRPSVQTYRGRSEFLELNQDLTQKLKRLSQDSGTTLFMTMLAVFTLLLSRYSGQEDIVVGSAIANRNRRETKPLIGFFVNTLALRTNLQENPTFLELLERVKQVTLDAYDHEDLPFEKLVDELGKERSLSHHPLFQVAFGLQNETQEKLETNRLTITRFEWENTTTLFDLSLMFRETPQGLTGEWEYATDLFEAKTIQRMVRHFAVLVQAIVDNPQQAINTLPLITEAERQQLQIWNQTNSDFPHNQTLVDLFEAQVCKTPNNIALVFEDQSLSYQELNQLANQLAHYLIENHKIKPDTLIGICVERSLEMVISLLGILKAGGAYVPIDPSYPQERIGLMLQDSGTSVLLTQSSLRYQLPLAELENPLQVICLDEANFAQALTENPSPQSTPDNLAYVIYTSGSTGQPKGVMIEHRGLVNLTLAINKTLEIQSQSRLLQFASFSFDASIWEIATAIAAGACLYLAKKETLLPSQVLVNFLADHKISHITLPPSVLSLLPQAALPDWQTIVVAGEACSTELVAQWAPERRFFNGYGPTESTVCASIALCDPNGKKLSIGQPLSNVRIYILDAHNQPLPPGIPGELCIAGVGLARGYLNRPELTAEKFIEVDLFNQTERIYKSGDLARWGDDGNIEYLGRIDDQIKLRGFRIELGEIESLLLQHPSVKEAVVILYEVDNNPRLVAYVMAKEKSVNLGGQLKDYLKIRLPNYMVPSQIIVLDKLPLTPNGKLDRRALPAPDIATSIDFEMPVTATEELLANLWQTLLKAQFVGRRDNFFELGGHSLLATQLVARIRDTFGVEVPVRKVFEQSVLSELATEIDKAACGIPLPPITPQAENEPKTLSFAQSRLWFLAQLEGTGTSATYNMSIALQLEGNLNIEALRASFDYLLKRHAILCTYFPGFEGEAQVVVQNPLDMEVLAIKDLRALDPQTQIETVQQLVNTHAQEPFDLNTGPLFKAKLLQLREQKYVLLINMHHIISDGWSMKLFKREWGQAYSAFAAGDAPNLSPLPIQYTDYAAWQRSWLQGDILETQGNYWFQQLSDAPSLLELPTDYPRPALQSYRGGHEEYSLSIELTHRLKAISQQQGVTLFMTLLAAFSILLSRYSRQEDLCIGSPIANRTHSHTEWLIGFFVNTLVLRSQIKPEQSFSELLQQTRSCCLDAYAHQDIPFEYLVEQLQPERSLSHNPLFQVMMVLQNTQGAGTSFSLPEIDIQGLEQSYPFAKFDLTLDLCERNDQLHCTWEYATDLFEADTIGRMAAHFEVLLEAIAQNPQQPIRKLPLITTAEIQQLQLWNQTNTDYPKNQTLVTLFEQQAAQTPDNIALVFEDQSLSYKELNQLANQLAHYLIENHKIKPDTLIGICVERSLEMVIGLLGILKAGGAYVPIDPNYPQERIGLMLQDSGTSVLLTQSSLRYQLPLAELENPLQVICLDEANFAQALTENPSPQSTPDNLAYVIYTSGSTGRPKGVMIEHRGLTNLASSVANTFQIQAQSRLLQFASFSFDISVAEITPTLTTGACLYLAKKETLLPSQGLVNFLADHKISHIILPPSALAVLPQASLPDLQTIAVGGEACPIELVSQWATGRSFFNGYGPTESTVGASIAICEPNGKKPPIGQPLSNIRIYILDAHNQPLPPGIPGELCIAGVGLARGYLNRPELTAEKFIEVDLFNQTERIYKSGDLARWGDDGNIEYLGRIDDQIKLRGFRIELGEIESLLLQHPSVKEAVVILYEVDNNPRLVAYVMAKEKSVNLGGQLKDYLKIRLPNYMVPSQIIVLDKLPLTPNGKLDRRALPAPDIATSIDFEMPVTATEELLANLWQTLLKAQFVGRRDNFFELGGHSLLATQLVARIRDTFGVEVPVRKVFEQSVLSELATEIDKAACGIPLPPITPQAENEPKTLSFAQSRLWFLAQLEGTGTSATYNMSIALQLEGNLNIEALRASFDYLLKRHAILSTYFPGFEGEAQVVVQNLEDMEVLAIKDLRSRSLDPQTQTETVQQLVNTHAQEPFDLNTGPLFKAKLLQLSEHKNVLLINMHHIISDGWSMGVFKREWEQAYSAFAVGDAPNLSPLPIQYTDYAAWQRSWLQGDILETQENYWFQQLSDAPSLLELPTDYPRPALQSYRGGHEEYSLSIELTHRLKAISQQQGVTLFMTLLAAFSILLSRYSRQEDLCIGSPIANRTHSHTEGLIGFFVNTLVLRSQIKPEQSFSELLQQTRSCCLDAYAHQDIPFEYLVEQLQPERSLSHNPLFQVMMVLQNTQGAGTSFSLPEIDIQGLEQSYPFAKFDLTLDLCERNDQLHCTWEYATDLFEADTIGRMAAHFEVLLEAITQNPQQPISKLPLITTAEIQQLQLWNQTNTDYPKNQTLVTLFEQQAAQTPDNIAVVFEDQSLNYQELNQKANHLAHYLLKLKIEQQLPDNPLIAIYVERSPEMVIGLFGILKAGGAYVPIDPNYPQERIRFMLEDCGAKVLLTHSQLKDKLAIAELERQYQVLCLDEDKFVKQSTDNPSCQSQADDLAYVIYTSGSTGRPKGVQLLHRGLTNYLHWAKDFYAVAQGQGTPVQSSLSFDATITSLYLPLICGRTTTLVREKQEIEALANIVKQNKHLSLVKITPSHLEILNQQLNPDAMRNRINAFVLGGEALHANQIMPWLTHAPDTRLINEYGPTEAVVGCCVYEATGKRDLIGDLLIGQPIANARIYILDNQNQPLPPGIPGELCIAGAGLARGYLNRPELTTEKFIELDLFGEQERVYKTGDLARWLPDGNLEYMGRIDNQVKLRGFRIELGEIETLLAKHPKIQQAVVILQGEDAIDKRLLAYIVPTPIDNDVEDKSLQVEQVELWQQVFNDSYSQQQTPTDDPTLNLAGWNNSYTGEPIPQTAMQEWRDTTVAQILELKAKRIWEIGCGTGLLLFKIAPHCQHYLGTDFSPKALHYIEQHLKQLSLNEKVTLKTSAANQFDGIETNAYDLVIINSVLQYFPSLDYFLQVLEGVVKAVKTQGSIFIGDVRNLQLLSAFHTAVEFYRAPNELSIKDLRQQIKKSIDTEGELLIDPDFFIALKQRIPRISHVQIQLQRGYAQTEMSRFRYDVVLHLDRTDTPVAEPQCLDWQGEQLNLETIKRILTTQQPDLLGIKNIPNARLTSEMALLEEIAQLDGTVTDLKAAVAQAKSGIETEAFRTLVRDLPYTPFIQYSPTGFSDYDVVFQRNIPGQATIPRFDRGQNLRLKPWQHYANQPLQYRTNQVDPALLAQLREFLAKNLPDYMIPSHFTVLEQLPLTPNGKVDRLALPAPNRGVEGLHEAPRNQVEQQLAQVWSAVLELQEIGIHDNFFDLGGHSLLAIKLLNHIQQVFEQKLSLSSLFQNPTIAQLAQQLCDPDVQQSNPDLLSLQPQGNATPLFCLPGANGHAFYFRDLAMNLGTERPVYGLETPGRDGLSPLPDSVAAYASQMIELLRQQQVKSPYILAGYSSGCAVAFEMAAQLEQHGEAVSLLAILDAGLVSQPKHITDRTELDWIWHMIERIRVIKGVSLGLEYDHLAAQPNDQARWDLAAEYLYRYNVLPEHSTVSLLKTNLRVMKLLTLNYATYQPNYCIYAPIVLFRAQEVEEIVVQELQAISRYDVPDWGWQTYTQKPVRVISVPGNHGQMLYGSNAKILAAQLQNFMT